LPQAEVRHAEQPAFTLPHSGNPFALRITRMNARTRCRLPVAQRTTGCRGAASPPVGTAACAPSPIPVAANLGDIAVNNTSDRRDV
jgi:hypothetical protein